MKRFFLLLITLNFILFTGCKHNLREELTAYEQANIYLNGVLLNLSTEEVNSIVRQAENLLAAGDDLGSRHITQQLVSNIKKNEQYIEISFPQNHYIITDNSDKIEISKLLIPLSGKFIMSGQLTIFYSKYSSDKQQAVICSNGYDQLRELLIGLEYL